MNEPMSKHTSYGIGGSVDAFITPSDKFDLKNILQYTSTNNIPVYFVGSGSNLLVADEGIDGVVITLAKSFKNLYITGCSVYAETGVMLGHLVKKCMGLNLTGLETMIGVPGTLGGALVMNAGAFGNEISNCLELVEVMTLAGTIKNINRVKLISNIDIRPSRKMKLFSVLLSPLKKRLKKKFWQNDLLQARDEKTHNPCDFVQQGVFLKILMIIAQQDS